MKETAAPNNWSYKVVDHFLDDSDFSYLRDLGLRTKVSPGEIVALRSRTNESKTIIPSEVLNTLQKRYEPIALEILNELAPKKVQLYEFCSFQISITDKNAVYPAHVDQPEKLLSGVIYLSPDVSTGTLLHKNANDLMAYEVPWMPNRAFFFSRHPKNTWHSYRGDQKGPRITLIFNLMTSKLREHQIIDQGNFVYFTSALLRKLTKRN